MRSVRTATAVSCMTELSTNSMQAKRAALIWFRRDLRIRDHQPLADGAATDHAVVLPVYCMDPRSFQRRSEPHFTYGVTRTGPFRCRATLEALHSLRADLQQLQSDLLVRIGQPEAVLPDLLAQLPSSCKEVQLLYHMEPLPEEADLEDAVEAACAASAKNLGLQFEVRRYWGHTLYHPDDLPYKQYQAGGQHTQQTSTTRINRNPARLACLPAVMTQFRKVTQQHAPIRPLMEAPARLPPLSAALAAATGAIPLHPSDVYRQVGAEDALQHLEALTGVSYAATAAAGAGSSIPHTAFPFTVGSSAAMQRLRHYLWGHPEGAPAGAPYNPAALAYFEDTRMQAVGVDNSTKLSPFMALGVLSPREVFHEVRALQQVQQQQQQQQQQEAVAPIGQPHGKKVGGKGAARGTGTASTGGGPAAYNAEWLIMHLCIRDFFIFTAMKEGAKLHDGAGIQGMPVQWQDDPEAFQRWAQGRTGLPFVDACMRELAGSGWMSNRGRQNTASVMAKDLRLDWRLGAALFESLLLDHEAAVNLANWNYFAGVGNDPRNRRFKTVTQGEKYDADAQLVACWVPELAHLPARYRHRPWETERAAAGKGGGGGGGAADQGGSSGTAEHFEQLDDGPSYPAPMVDVHEHIGVVPPAAAQN